MRSLVKIGLVWGLLVGMPARAETFDMRTLKCGDFLKQTSDFHGSILMWLSAYSMTEDDDPIIDFDRMTEIGKKLGTYCALNPDAGVMKAYELASR